MEERLQLIDIANKTFGESGWSFSITKVDLDYVDDNHSGLFSAGTTAVVRIQRTNGVFREDVGYGVASGPNKAEVISKAKKDAVTDGLKGAVMNFGGDIAKKVNNVTPCKSENNIPQSPHVSHVPHVPGSSPLQAAVKPCLVSRNIIVPAQQGISGNQSCAPVMPSSSSAVVAPKVSPVPTRVAPVPRKSPPLALPLPQSTNSGGAQISEEELAKIERKKLQRQRQEEFRKKHLLEQAQAQSKAQEKQVSKIAPQQPRVPLKEQQPPRQHSKEGNSSKGVPNNSNATEGDDDVLLSTQDMEAMVEIAANNSTMSRRSPMLSSPSLVRTSTEPPQSHSRLSTGHKRPDLSTYAFNPEKKPKGRDG